MGKKLGRKGAGDSLLKTFLLSPKSRTSAEKRTNTSRDKVKFCVFLSGKVPKNK